MRFLGFLGSFWKCTDRSRSVYEPLTVFNFSVEPLILYLHVKLDAVNAKS
jgi:hypothetical protein